MTFLTRLLGKSVKCQQCKKEQETVHDWEYLNCKFCGTKIYDNRM